MIIFGPKIFLSYNDNYNVWRIIPKTAAAELVFIDKL